MSNSSAARTNLSSNSIRISNRKIGEGTFRITHEGTYIGGNRNQQEAACKRFKPQWRHMEQEYFQNDFDVADIAIQLAEQWNEFADPHEKILVSRGHIITSNSGIQYLAEPLIRNFRKFTSNSGWISSDGTWTTEIMEAFTHFTYHKTRGRLIVCDLQGRYRHNKYCKKKSRFELSDPAICSRDRRYGVTDLSEKGIESFFANHCCNQFCHMDDEHWMKPRYTRQWFPSCSGTSMMSSSVSYKLQSTNATRFVLGSMGAIVEADSDGSDDY